MKSFENLGKLLFRRKCMSTTASSETKLKKCLSTIDLIALGIGCTLGCGIYVVTGEVVRNITGPAVVISFAIAALASVLAALSYAEFGARVPKAGSAYIYSYVTVGEIWAFVIGWNLVLEYVIGAASTAKATSSYLDALFDHQISAFLTKHVPINVPTLSPFPDFMSFGAVMILTVIVCFGIQESSIINNVFMVVNVSILIFVIIAGAVMSKLENWEIPADKIPNPEINGKGGFFPFGYLGVIKGASVCFYSYIGFDVITIAGEETVNPKKSIPISILSSLTICSVTYILLTSVLTLMVPYYVLEATSPLSSAFNYIGWNIAGHVINVGAIICLISCLLTYVLAMPRVFYAMASDGLIFKVMARVNQRFKTPVVATIVSGILTAILAMLLELIDLVNMMSIGTLLAYTLVSISVLLLRYQPEKEEYQEMKKILSSDEEKQNNSDVETGTLGKLRRLLFKSKTPSQQSYDVVRGGFFMIAIMTIWSSCVTLAWTDLLFRGTWWVVILFLAPNCLTAIIIILLCFLPKQKPEISFLVPLVPVLPIFSAMINIYLMINLPSTTWLRFVIWMIVGFFIYFGYGIRNSSEGSGDLKQDYKDIDGGTMDSISSDKPEN